MVPDYLPRKSKSSANEFYKLVLERNLAAADRTLTEIRRNMKDSDWEKGYLNALEGMIVAERSGDTRYVYLSRLDLKNHKKLEEARRTFQAQAKNPLEGEFDRGFFSAWSDFLRTARLELDTEKGEEPKTLSSYLEE
jgi:hypothetical protein